MEENQFFEEMKPLLKDYVEFTKEDMSEKWGNMEKEALAKVEESQARLSEAKDKEMEARRNKQALEKAKISLKKVVAIIGDEEYKSIEGKVNEHVEKIKEYAREFNSRKTELAQAKEEVEQTKNRIEQEKQERMDKQQEKQENLYAKAKDFLESTKEKMRQEVEEKTNQLEEMTKKRRELATEAKTATDLDLTIKRSADEVKNSETYKAVSKNAQEELQKRKAMYKAYNHQVKLAKEELKGAEAQLASFEEKYDVIDFASEAGIQSLIEITGWEEENVMTLGQENDTQQQDIDEGIEPDGEEEKWQVIKAIYAEREEGHEDLLSPDYLVLKYQNLAMKDVDEAMKIALTTKGKSLVEIYENCLGKLEKDHPHYTSLEELIAEVRERDEVLQMTESNEGELSPAEIVFLAAKYGEKECLITALKLMYRKMEQNFEDLLAPEYIETKEFQIKMFDEDSYSEEQVKEELLFTASKTLKDICLEQLEIAKQEKDKGKINGLTRMIKRVEKREKSLQKSNGQNSTRQNSAQQAPAGQNPAPQAPTRQNPAPQAPAGQNPAPQAPTRQNPAPQAPAGQNPAPQAPTRQNPAQQTPAGQNPAQQTPAGQNPAPQTPRGSNPVEMNKNGNIKIQYLIESDSYEIQKENPWGGFSWNIIKRSELDDRIDDDTLEKINAMDGACVDILKCLHKMDQGLNTTMMNDYIDIVVNSISKAETTRLMKEKGIDVRYDLKGQAVPKEVRREMEQIAKMAKSMGMAKVEKGFFAGIAYKIQGMFGKLTNKTKLLDKSEKQKKFKFLNRKKKRDMANTQVVEEPKRSSRENLGMEKYNINHESAIQHAQEGRKEERAPITME